MISANFWITCNHVVWRLLCLVCLLVTDTILLSSAMAQQTEGVQPNVYKQIAPQVMEMDLGSPAARARARAGMTMWTEGDTVRVVEDLK